MSRIVAARLRGDEGMAMVMTIGLMMLTAIIGTTLLATTVFTTSNTTATRADVEAVAAAEAGVEAVMASLQNGALACGSGSVFHSPADGFVDYTVTVTHRPAGSAVWTPGCATDADALRLVSVGRADNRATGGNERGEEATVEMLLERPNPQPRFNKAIFGDLHMNVNTGVTVNQEDPAYAAALYTRGPYTCSTSSTVDGSLYVGGTATFSSQPCHVVGDVYVEQNFTCAAGTTIGGNLYVQGNASFTGPCHVGGDLMVGGDLSNSHGGSTIVGRGLYVRGKITANPMLSVTPGQTIRVGGPINFSWTGPGSPREAFFAMHPGATEYDGAVPMPPEIPESTDNNFPKIFADGTTSYVGSTEPPGESIWDGWATRSWRESVRAIWPGYWESGLCAPWGANFTGPLVVDTDTVFDTRSECSSVILAGNNPVLELNADAVILVNSLTIGAPFHVQSGDGANHSLYIVAPWPAGQATCQSSPTSLTLQAKWSQDDKTSVLFYSPNAIKVNGNPTIRGQVYGCAVNADTAFTMDYVPVGDVSNDNSLHGLRLQHIRDVTN